MAYYLMSDNRRRMPSDAYLRAELTEAHDPRHAFPSGAAGLLCGAPAVCQTAVPSRARTQSMRGIFVVDMDQLEAFLIILA